VGEALSSPADLRELATTRLRDAEALLGQARWSCAYYVAGYAVECGLKACITREFGKYRMPNLGLVKDSYTHDLEKLVSNANLRPQLDLLMSTDNRFALNWTVVKDWKETSRYEIWTESEAQDLYEAIAQRGHGVFRWVKQHW
jgi:HEPN domain-containing protein